MRPVFIDAIEVTIAVEPYYTPEQLGQIEQRRLALGEEGMQRAQQDWAELIAAVDAERTAGTDPADPAVQALIVRWNGLIEQFTGGDTGVRASLRRMYEDKGVEQASHGAMDVATMAYVQRAMDAGTEAARP